MIAVTAEPKENARIQTCARLATLVQFARASDAKLIAKDGNLGYRGSAEELMDLHDWFIDNHPRMVAAFCTWCSQRRELLHSSPSGIDIRLHRRVVQFDTSRFDVEV